MREARRLRLIERQALIAGVSRKQALRTLAEALEGETRSRALADRSSALVAASAPVCGETSGSMLQARAAFTASLAQLSATAGAAAEDAARQSAWAADTLARTEMRRRRLDELAGDARAALEAAKDRRAAGHEASATARRPFGT